METLNKLLEVIDSNSKDMPEGVYLQLMNLLKEQHTELKENKDNEIKELTEFTEIQQRIMNKQRTENKQLKQQIKDKDCEILYEKKKNNALIQHLGGNIEFNKSLNEFKEDKAFKEYFPHLSKNDKNSKRIDVMNKMKQ